MIAQVLAMGLALAGPHGARECPAPEVIGSLARRGPLSAAARACAEQAAADHRIAAWAVLADDALRGADDLGPRLDDALSGIEDPTAALVLAERLPVELAPRAAERAWALSGAWTAPMDRATSLVRLAEAHTRWEPEAALAWARGAAWVGLVGEPLERARAACAQVAEAATCRQPAALPARPPAAPAAEDLSVCTDLGRMWTRSLHGAPWATERDCLVRAAEGLRGEAAVTAAHLALRLALRYREREQAVVVAHRLARAVPEAPELAHRAAALHREFGDPAGARYWEEQAADASTR